MGRFDVIQEVCIAKRRNIGQSDIDTIVELEKFNPYHGPDGRFTTADSATSFTIRTRAGYQQYMADNAIAREKQRADAENAQQGNNGQEETKESDQKASEAIKLTRGESMSIDEACKGANPNFSQGGEYRVNCQRCVQAYEFRRRGYDVSARPKTFDESAEKIVWGSECFSTKEQYSSTICGGFTMRKTESAVRKEIENAPDGARYAIYVQWKRNYGGSAHVFIGEKVNGEVRYVDPQSGREDASSHFENGSRGKFGFYRLDDKELTTDAELIEQTVEVNDNDQTGSQGDN